MATTYQHRTISSRMEFFFMFHYLFLSLSEEGLVSFYVAELLNSKRKEKEQPGHGAELFLRAPLTLGRVGLEAPGEAAQAIRAIRACGASSNPWRRQTPGTWSWVLLQCDTQCVQVATVLVPESRKRYWNKACESINQLPWYVSSPFLTYF